MRVSIVGTYKEFKDGPYYLYSGIFYFEILTQNLLNLFSRIIYDAIRKFGRSHSIPSGVTLGL